MPLISPCLFRLSGRVLSSSLAISFLVLPALGCRTGSKDRLETTLRQREKEISLMREDIDRIAGYNLALQTEVRAMRGQSLPNACDPFTPLYPVRSIVVGRTSVGMDDDGKPGDDAVQVVLETRDGDGKLFRAPGKVQMQMLEVTPEGLKNLIGTYQFGPEEMRPLWKQGLLTSGYVFNLPWQTPPRQDKVRVVASFTMEDGRQFEAEREIRVKPPANPSLSIIPDGPNSGPIIMPANPTYSGPSTSPLGEFMPGLVPAPGSPSPFPDTSTLPFPKMAPPTVIAPQPGKTIHSPPAQTAPQPQLNPKGAPSIAPGAQPSPIPMPGATFPHPVPPPADPKKFGVFNTAPTSPIATLQPPRALAQSLEGNQ